MDAHNPPLPVRDEEGREYHDYEFEEPFEPCTGMSWPSKVPCGSRIRIARFYPGLRRIGFRCDHDHKLNWENRGLWIPMDVFGNHGEYAGMIPEAILPERRRPGLTTTINLSAAMVYQARQAKECCVCDCPPFHDAPLKTVLLTIAEHKKALYRDIKPFLATMIESEQYSDDWLTYLPPELQAAVLLAKSESRIEADHGIPRSILQQLWLDLSSQERNAATSALAFPLCAACNKGKRNFLDATSTILKRFAKVRYQGDERIATKDPAYPHILSLCTKAQRLRLQA